MNGTQNVRVGGNGIDCLAQADDPNFGRDRARNDIL